jgi:hypothetical protein
VQNLPWFHRHYMARGFAVRRGLISLFVGRVFKNLPNSMSLARMWLSNQLPTSLADSQRLANVIGIGGLCRSAFALGVLG